MARSDGPGDRGIAYLHCPRCRLTISPRAARLGVRHCPRCVARSQVAVELFSSPLRGEDLWQAHGRAGAGGPEVSTE